MPSWAGFAFLVFLSSRFASDLNRNYVRFVLAAAIGTTVLCLMHLAGAFFEVLLLIQLIPIRSTMLFVYIAMPLAGVYLLKKLSGECHASRAAATFVILFLGVFGFGFLWPALLALALTDLSDGCLGPFRIRTEEAGRYKLMARVLMVVLLVCGVGYAFGVIGEAVMAMLLPGAILSATNWLLAVIAAVVIVTLIGYARQPASRLAWAAGMLLIGLIGVDFYKSSRTGAVTRAPSKISLLEAQLWAREHTDEDAHFLAYQLPWRNRSHRSLAAPGLSSWFVYSARRSTFAHDERYLAHLGLSRAVIRDMTRGQYGMLEHTLFYDQSLEKVLALAQSCEVDYIVRRRERALALKEVFANEHYVIYEVPRESHNSVDKEP